MLMMSLFYSARENEAYQSVKPFVEDLYQNMVRLFMGASGQLGNMNGRQEQFALGFTGMLDLHSSDGGPGAGRLSGATGDEEALAKQFMHGIFS